MPRVIMGGFDIFCLTNK
ncbi:hypothetical protein F383_34876 [Gossypium arboreum]|uniref:Uncharacterized protein n=1 Tax=Gossypium arboreum TaxID=29729 RepID=A0A0B0PVX7_GOSAR|nr:hypothetical protein F383_34876 [Gossypium arboreum]